MTEKKYRSIKYRLYPTDRQKEFFLKSFGCCRFTWNAMLEHHENTYAETGKGKYISPAALKKEHDFLKEIDSLALANVQQNFRKAWRSFFKKEKGRPHFKSKKSDRFSYTTNINTGGNSIMVFDRGIKLPKVNKKYGLVKARIHKAAPADWLLKSATISMDRDGRFHASILYELPEQDIKYVPDYNNAIGLDYKSDGLFCDSEGNVCGSPKCYRKAQKRLARQQKKLSRKKGSKKGERKSNNYLKQQLKVNRIHSHIANARKDFLHKKSTEIANLHDIVCVESLNMRAMSNKGFRNGKATMDNGYGMFLTFLEYKLKDRGKLFVKVDKWYPSSQTCSNCGSIHKLSLSERTYECPECGLVMDRDRNAAMNIKKEGLRLLGL